ncbi:IS21 family transposase [Neisseriaceae bacterium TC5R-5]|nr:IS21 family transposase [Neisseriaceae bacterium TC5R-5]
MKLSRATVRKHLNTVEEPQYKRPRSPAPKLATCRPLLEQWLQEEATLPRSRRRTARRLCYSRQMFVVAYPRETQEMVFDAHTKAFEFFGGVPNRMIYDNLKSVVDVLYRGKERQFNRRFLVLANHYLFEPVACTPASGWEKGQVENQVGNIREWLFTPLARFDNLEALNDWLRQRCLELVQRKHPTEPTQTIAECFAHERPLLRPVLARFDGYVEQLARVSSTCLVRVDRNRYSVGEETRQEWCTGPTAVPGGCGYPGRVRLPAVS